MADKKRFSDIEVIEALRVWWSDLDQDRGGRARLRRSRSLLEVAFCPAFHGLRLALKPLGDFSNESMAAVAGVLAHVEGDDQGVPTAARMARPKEGSDTSRVSGLRFRRLLAAPDRHALFPQLVRVLGLLDHRADLGDLARLVYFWGPNVRKDMALKYYDAAPDKKDFSKP
ncbi:MAG: type I-E CRISPR-associated protein Cse2/CasB [Proteobacteria bacterium]|nr:type I-E CRISPR-associated protein Cse2/CasB [Pseudomonadota bacterium]